MTQTTATSLPPIGDVIRAWRLYRGLRSTELAAKAGVRSQYLSEIEHNRTANPRQGYLEKLAIALEVPLQDIYGRRMPPEKEGEDGEVEEEEEQSNGAPTDSAGHPSISIRSLPSSTTGGKADRLIASGRFSEEEEMEVEAAVIELINRFISFKETQRKMQKGD